METITTPRELSFEYEFIKLLGEGSNGKTWLAKERQTNDLVAIKALKLNDDPKQLELFQREAATLKSIRMSGVPKFKQSIIPANPLAQHSYIIQQYIDYPSLQDSLKIRKKFTEIDTLQILLQVCNILHDLQTQYAPPIIHRDIKPSNILCKMRDNGAPSLYLIDFGAVANPQKKSNGSTIAGTFGYMAPEQMLGDVSIQSDFYSLGALAIHLLTGVSPVTIESDVFDLKFDAVLQEFAPDTSTPMKTLLHWLTASVAENRPKSADQIIRAIQKVMVKENFSPESFDAPPAPKKLKKKSWFNKLFGPSSINIPPRNEWATTTCVVRGVSTASGKIYDFDGSAELFKRTKYYNKLQYEPPKKNILIYTYIVGKQTYCGMCFISNDNIALANEIGFPFEGNVSYFPNDPRINHFDLKQFTSLIRKPNKH